MPRLEADRLSMKAVLENRRSIGFHPGAMIDVGFAFGAPGLQETLRVQRAKEMRVTREETKVDRWQHQKAKKAKT